MTTPAKHVLIIGGGFTGMSTAIELRKQNVDVDLVEIDENWRTDGAGITVSGPSLRAIEKIGVLAAFLEQGAITSGIDIYSASGHHLSSSDGLTVPGTAITGTGGIMRPVLAKILANATRESGTNVKLGLTYSSITDKGDYVEVNFTDGSKQSYDLVIAADGVFSSVRKDMFPGAPSPGYSGQGVWRAVVPRFGMERSFQCLSEKGKVGCTPISSDEMYLYYTDHRPNKERIPPDQLLPQLKSVLKDFDAPIIKRIHDHLSEENKIMYRPLEGMLMPRPWYKGRILLLGDCVHATTPHLASGAGMGHEDAVVLGEEFAKGGDLIDVLERYQNRRWARCSFIVNNSFRLGAIEIEGKPMEEHLQILQLSLAALLAPI
jgi:2-polyprenyl-6-methoxyphenol hydroxylase-like FAD-dependent oxidoreductase